MLQPGAENEEAHAGGERAHPHLPDRRPAGGGGTDKFRVKIWDTVTGTVVYDNLLGAGDTANPTTVITSGSITITKP